MSRHASLQRLIAIVVLITVVVACSAVPDGTTGPGATSGAGATRSTTSTGPAITFAPVTVDTSSFDPAALADAVVGASTDQARAEAVIRALASIGLGVWTAEGEPIVRGAERTSTDFVVYDFEVIGLAGGIADADVVSLDEIAAELSAMNVAAGGTAFTAGDFAAAVTQATAAALADIDVPNGRALRLARELGVRGSTPFDLAIAPSDAPIVLDPLSAFLVAADYSLPRILGAEPPPVTSLAGPVGSVGQFANAGDTAALLAAADPCVAFQRQNGAWYAGRVSLPGSNATNASFSRSLQARLLGGTVKMGGRYEGAWHHKHKGGQAEEKLYSVALQVRAPMPRRVNCGPIRLRDGQMQGGGQIVGAEVVWVHPDLERHGRIDCSAADCPRTNTEGVARLHVRPHEEPGPGGIGPEIKKVVTVSAQVNLLQALGADLLGALSLPPDMRIYAIKEMRSEISWHRGYDVTIGIDSQLYVDQAQGFSYADHVGTAKLVGALQATTLHQPGDLAFDAPRIELVDTETKKGTGPLCTTGYDGSEGSITTAERSGDIDMQVIDLVIYPPEELTLYLDVGPANDYSDDSYRLVQCAQGKVIQDSTGPGTNLWEATIFAGYARGLRFSGVLMQGAGAGTSPGVWNWTATQANWEGTSTFVVAQWDTPQDCGGFCDEGQSWLKMWIIATPLADP